MKFNKLKTILFILVIFTLASCSQDEPIEPVADILSEDNTPLVELQFTTSPIDLQGVDAQFAQDVPYDEFDDTQFDVFLPNSSTPTGLVVFIHGGGFTGGDKQFIYTDNFPEQVVELLSNNLAVATINYRLLVEGNTEGVLLSLNDSRRAIQYMRYIHQELNIDTERIALFGSSAGGSTSLWIATHDDLRDENNPDPVLRESTRVSGIALRATQSSLDIESRWVNDVFGDFSVTWDDLLEVYGEESIYSFYGVSSQEEYESPEIDEYRRSVDMLSQISFDDPEIWVQNTGPRNDAPTSTGSFNHHPFHAREIQENADAAGISNVSTYGNPILVSDPTNESFVDFLIRKLNE